MAELKRREIAVVQSYLSHFRVPFWQALRPRLEAENVELRLLYGVTDGPWARVLDWAEPFDARKLPGGATWHPVLAKVLRTADLVVVEDASRHLLNYLLLAARALGGPKLGVWGHGWNHQGHNLHGPSERLKRFVGRRADVFFAYTHGVRRRLIELGYDAGRVHEVRNTIAAPKVRAHDDEVERLRRRLGIGTDARVVLYCGQMYPMKRLELLVAAAEQIKREAPRLELILAGAGPTQGIAEAAARRLPYVHYIGPVFGSEKSACFGLADVYVLPGAVGLGIVDAFHHHCPAVVTTLPLHGPEIDYLQAGRNGLVTEHSAAALATAIALLLRDDALRARLVEGCRATSCDLSVEAMATRFADAVLATLRPTTAPPRQKGSLSYE